jgi:hypothetical protein
MPETETDVLPFHTSTLLNDEKDENGLVTSHWDFHCSGCGQRQVGQYSIRYLLCNRCLTQGNPMIYKTKTKEDRL